MAREIEGRPVEACPNDDFVLWHDPKVATAVVVESAGGIVLGRRAIEPALGEWCLPGGFVNDDESPVEAAMRECLEEIGAAIDVTGLIGLYHIARRTAPSMIIIGYRARLSAGASLEAGQEMQELQVFAPDQLPELAFSSHGQIIADYVRSQASPAGAAPPHGAAAARRASPPSPAPRRSKRPRTQ